MSYKNSFSAIRKTSIDFGKLKEAIESGHKASSVLLDVMTELSEKHHCPESIGFEGLGTFPDCGECVYCLAKRIVNDERR